MPLNDSQRRVVVSTLAHVSELLGQVDRIAASEGSPFSLERLDLSPHELRMLAAFVAQARRRMLSVLEHLGIPRPAPRVSSRWSLTTTLMFAEVALEELNGSTLRGYGQLDAAVCAEVEAAAAELRSVIGRGRALLQDVGGAELTQRLASIPGPEGEILREVGRLATEHHLPELQPLLSAAAERLSSETFDVGVFGRVSAGKSSLINAMVGASVLPVGAIPVTAVALRIGHGPTGAVVSFEDGRQEEVPLGALVDFATEEGNAGNRRGVRGIEARTPEVPEHVAYVDTPGTGTLAGTGGASSFAWLARCDVGLVLIPAASAIETEDVALMQALDAAGVPFHVLLSKADLLSPGEIERSDGYIRGALRSLGAGDVPVIPVSVLARASADLAELRAALARSGQQTGVRNRERIRARFEHLVSAAAAGLAGREGDGAAVIDLRVQLARARREVGRICDELASSTPAALDAAAEAIVTAWATRAEAADAARAILLEGPRRGLESVSGVLDGAASALGEQGGWRRMPPVFEHEVLTRIPPLPRPSIPWLTGWRARRALAEIEVELAAGLKDYAERLRIWGAAPLDTAAEDPAMLVPVSAAAGGLEELRARVAALDSDTTATAWAAAPG